MGAFVKRWLGSAMDGDWQDVGLADLYEFASGLSKPREEFGFGHPFVSFKDVFDNYFLPEHLNELVNSNQEEQDACSIRRGDVLLTRTSETVDELGMSSVALRDLPRATFNGFTKRLRPKSDLIYPEYAAYYFRSPLFRRQMFALSNMSTRASLNNEMLERLTARVLPMREQVGIGQTLKMLDDKIELNRHVAKTLEAMARALFKSWFIDFDPVHAKAEGRSTGLPDDLAALFPDSFGEGELPTGWKLTAIANLFEVRGGNTPRTENGAFWDGEHQWATPKDLSGLATPVLIRTSRQLTDLGLNQVSSGLLPPGSLLLSTRAPIGYMAFTTLPTAINQGFAGFARVDVSPVYAWTWCQANMEVVTGNASGSTFPEISKAVLRQLPMLVPTQVVLDAFGAIADPLVERIVAATKEMQTLAELRDTLLPKLISGELRFTEVERKVSAA